MLNITAKELWEKEIQDYIVNEIIHKYRTDEILIETLKKLVNNVNSDIVRNQDFSFRIKPITDVLSSNNYYLNGALKKAFPEEIKAVHMLSEKLTSLYKIANYEESHKDKVEEPEIKPNRLPNPQEAHVEDLYKPTNNSRKEME
jgi:hypothetical protein